MVKLLLWHAFYFCLLAMITTSCPAGQEADSELVDQFRNGVRQIEAISERLNLRLKVVGVVQHSGAMLEANRTPEDFAKLKASGIDSEEYEFVREYAVRGDSKLEIGTDEQGVDFAVACNPDYVFSLKRKKGAKDYSLHLLEQRGIDPKVEQLIDQTSAASMSHLLSGWTISGERLDKLVESEEFQIKKIAEVTQGGAKLIRIDYQRRVAEVRVGKLSYGDSYMLCDPDKHWGIVEYAVTIPHYDGKGISRNEAHIVLEMVHAVPVSSQVIATVTFGDDPKIVEQSSATYEIISTDVSESDFLISAFGLPEPNFNPGFSSRFWYSTILATVCLLGAWLIRKRKQRT